MKSKNWFLLALALSVLIASAAQGYAAPSGAAGTAADEADIANYNEMGISDGKPGGANETFADDDLPAGGTLAEESGADRPDRKELTEIVREAEPSVVGIIGKLGKFSKEYYEVSENIMFGSGIIYKSNGFIISNHHVIKDCESIFVILSNRKIYEARVVGVDEASDLALLKIDKGMLKPVVFADSSAVKAGEPVITIGTPVVFDLQNSVGQGIISGINRGNTGFTEYQFLQTDAVSNPGNSGGPLMNYNGEVLGIIEGGYVSYPGITFCIPSQTILYVAPQLLKYGRVRRPDPGATLVQSLMADYGLPSERGLFFTDIESDGPLALAGVTEDDILLSINGVSVNTYSQYAEELMKYLPGDTVDLTLSRDGVKRIVRIIFIEKE